MNRYRLLILNFGLFAVNAIATKFVTFILIPLYTYHLTAGEYGITDMSLTVISLITPLVTFSIADAVVRFMVGDRTCADEYFVVGFTVTLASVVVVSMATPLLDLSVFGGLGHYKIWFVIAYASNAFLQFCGEAARGMGTVRLIPVCAGISSFITGASAVALIGGAHLGVVGYFASVSVGPFVAIAAYFTIGGMGAAVSRGARSVLGGLNVRERLLGLCRRMLGYSLPLIPNSLFWWVGTSINRFFITAALGISASGMFAAGSKVPNLLNTAYSIFQQAWQLSAFQESGEDDLAGFFSSVFSILQAAMCALCAAISLLSPWLASFFLQGEFYSAWTMVPIMLLANLMNVFNSFYGTVYTATMHTGYIMRTTAVGAVCSIALTPALLPFLGVYGACIAFVASQAIVFAMRAVDSRRYIVFDAGWRCLLPSILILIVQAFFAVLQLPGWQLASIMCFIFVVSIQGIHVYPKLSHIKRLIIGHDGSQKD